MTPDLQAMAQRMVRERIPMREAVDSFAKEYVYAALLAARGDATKAARKIGVHRNTIHNWRHR